MPARGSGAGLNDDVWITRSEDDRVLCRACSAGNPPERHVWIARRSTSKHEDSADHRKALAIVSAGQQRLRDLELERQLAARTRLAPRQPAQPILAPVPMQRVAGVPSMAEAEMWRAYEEDGAAFSAGLDTAEDGRVAHSLLDQQAELFGLWDPEGVAQRLGFGNGMVEDALNERDEEEDFLAELLANAGVAGPTEEEIQTAGTQRTPLTAGYFPYPNKTVCFLHFSSCPHFSELKMVQMFLLDILDNLPRLRVSKSLMRVILWIMRETGAQDIPSLEGLNRVQKEIRAESGIPTLPCLSPLGNVFFMNDPCAIVAHDWANPAIRKHIRVYPEIPSNGIVCEIWHAQKWRKNMDLDALSPMYDAGNAHFYVNELCRLQDGKFVVPIRWVTVNSAVWADCYSVEIDTVGEAAIDDSKTYLVAAADMKENYLDLLDLGAVPPWNFLMPAAATFSKGHPARMPNRKRAIAGGCPMYTSLVDYFGDDVSGNRSKSWNKHWNAYMTHRNLPRKLLQQEYHIHFVSTSPNASISEQYREFKTAIEATHTKPIAVQDDAGNTTKICVYCNAGPSDNPMQSEVSSHMGGQANYFCRKCKVGGPKAHKHSNVGYEELFKPGVPRTKEYVLDELRLQVRHVCGGTTMDKLQKIQRNTGVKDAYTQQWITGLEARFAQLSVADPERPAANIKAELMKWVDENDEKIYSAFLRTTAFDPTRDTPIELLHTILLGAVKYVWHISHTGWSDKEKTTYSQRLQATETSGLSIHAIRAKYIMQYANSLIGKQLKTVVQTGIFHVHDLVSDDHLAAWQALGELSALLWVPEIHDITQYHTDLETAVANLLDAVAVIDPSKIITKIKYHLLAHAADDAMEFGPLIGLATELFESFNAIFRYCSVLSNHLAPSRDIALQLGDQEGLKHRLTGGLWAAEGKQKWVRAGSDVRHYLEKHPILQKLLGWTPQKSVDIGNVKLTPLTRGEDKRLLRELSATTAAKATNYHDYASNSGWDNGKSFICQSQDECRVGSWVFAPWLSTHTVIPARVVEILKGTEANLAVLERFQTSANRDPVYGMPALIRPDGETLLLIVPTKDVSFSFNAQHDCRAAQCAATGSRAIIQERVASEKTEHFVIHKDLDRYIINLHSFHNAHLLRATLPPPSLGTCSTLRRPSSKAHRVCDAAFRNRNTAKGAKGASDGVANPASDTVGTTMQRAKRRRAKDNDSDAESAPARKRARKAAPKKKKPKAQANAIPIAVSVAISGSTSLAAGRTKRTITKTVKALAAEEASSDSEEVSDSDQMSEKDYETSDEEYQ
ncbi:hypothetical protein MIND_00115300 [Mycena indigotica]|uniref:Uncharacterized protein n=1 Tax=Mycena indigotica TaxID=2126181 RepID=A0A8H6TE23_9AGAR|nr:uncharacterized protein MIND_00115300 [Mycena indigotica]KAF7315983.1 hypothetical protein MIND_00115300 [Mycena indigotica]